MFLTANIYPSALGDNAGIRELVEDFFLNLD